MYSFTGIVTENRYTNKFINYSKLDKKKTFQYSELKLNLSAF